MKYKKSSYNMYISKDKKSLINLDSKVALMNIDEQGLVGSKVFNSLKHPLRATLSSNGKMIAYNNTLGHCAVHDIETGALLVKSRCLSKEGRNLYFINNDTQIISTAFGSVFILDIKLSEVKIIHHFDPPQVIELIQVENDLFILVATIPNGKGTMIYELQCNKESDNLKEIATVCDYSLWISSFAKTDNEVYFYANNTNNETNDRLTFRLKENSIYRYNIDKRTSESFISIQKDLGINLDTYEHGYFTCIDISNNRQYALIGFSKSLIIVDLIGKELLKTIKIMDLSSFYFLESDSKILLATWKTIKIIGFSDILTMDEC